MPYTSPQMGKYTRYTKLKSIVFVTAMKNKHERALKVSM